jgi:1,4-dihydroxy-2-naphthoyl-CoA hydrolase
MLGEMAPDPPRGMARHFGIRIIAADKDKVVGEIDADDRHLNAGGIVHGGAYMAFADEIGGHAAGLHLLPGTRTTTIESKTNFFRACRAGRLVAEAVPLHVGRRMIVVQTSIYGPDGKRAAMVTQTQLVLPRKPANE